jgi:hypothetical protein
MATLTQLTLDADGTIGSEIRHDAGTGSPFYTLCLMSMLIFHQWTL